MIYEALPIFCGPVGDMTADDFSLFVVTRTREPLWVK
jgi:hypothetical protein